MQIFSGLQLLNNYKGGKKIWKKQTKTKEL